MTNSTDTRNGSDRAPSVQGEATQAPTSPDSGDGGRVVPAARK